MSGFHGDIMMFKKYLREKKATLQHNLCCVVKIKILFHQFAKKDKNDPTLFVQVAVAIMKFACFFIRGVLVCLAFLWICAAGAKVKIAGALRERIGESFSDNFPAFRWSLGFAKQSGASLLLWPEFALAFPAKGVSRKSVFPFCDGNVPQVGWTCGSEGVQGNASSIAKAVGCAAEMLASGLQ